MMIQKNKNFKLFLVSFFLITIINFAHSQETVNYQVFYKKIKNNEFDKSGVLLMDYLNKNKKIYFYFGVNYSNEKVNVFNNKKEIFKNVLNTNSSIESSSGHIFFNSDEINKIDLIFKDVCINFELNNKYLYLKIDKLDNKVILTYYYPR